MREIKEEPNKLIYNVHGSEDSISLRCKASANWFIDLMHQNPSKFSVEIDKW